MPSQLPPAYRWLHDVKGVPQMVQEAVALLGVHELEGIRDNQTILGWAREVRLANVYTHDSIAWCGLLCAVVAKRASKPVVEGALWAANWCKWGRPSPLPSLGDVIVYTRPGGHHVNVYIAEDEVAYHGIGGNQSDTVSIARILKSRAKCVRRPKYKVQPDGVRPYFVGASGALSTDEK